MLKLGVKVVLLVVAAAVPMLLALPVLIPLAVLSAVVNRRA